MGRSKQGKTRFECGHRGFGAVCRRCLNAQKVLDNAYKMSGQGKIDAFLFRKMRIEAARLRSNGTMLLSDLEWAGFDQKESGSILDALDS